MKLITCFFFGLLSVVNTVKRKKINKIWKIKICVHNLFLSAAKFHGRNLFRKSPNFPTIFVVQRELENSSIMKNFRKNSVGKFQRLLLAVISYSLFKLPPWGKGSWETHVIFLSDHQKNYFYRFFPRCQGVVRGCWGCW